MLHTIGAAGPIPILRIHHGPDGPPNTPAHVQNVSSMQLLHAWLAKCDQNHQCGKLVIENGHSEYKLPTRLLNVTASSDPDCIRLDSLPPPLAERRPRYIALSHCWGQSNPGMPRSYLTIKDNLRNRQKGFKLSESHLPKNFQDAITVTRELGVQYLWIDSLCIIQDQDDDWEQESRLMEQVYASAYCTIAATSAKNPEAGFLGESVDNQSIYVQHMPGQHTYVSTIAADFETDVNKANLNKRAWVMQERLLSPRTIHFCRNQVYAECGEGIRAGCNIFLRSYSHNNNYFKLDPKFPYRLGTSGYATTLEFLQSLVKDYTRCDISVPTDRAVAISGLMDRIETALPGLIHHGIIELCLHRTLLWKRSLGPKTKRIEYKASEIPSWSWMAYEGAIDFVCDKYYELDVIKHMTFNARFITATIWEFTEHGMKMEEDIDFEFMRYQLVDLQGTKKGWISFDEEADLPTVQYMVVVAKRVQALQDNFLYFVLFIKPLGDRDGYERLGVGMLQKDCGLRKKVEEGHVY